MDIRRGLYYILFLGIILGSFASMARNNYGLELVSICCYLFATSFIVELIIGKTRKNLLQVLEHLSLAVLFILFGMRAGYIYFPYLELIVIISCLVLGITYSVGLMGEPLRILRQNRQFGMILFAYYLGLVVFLLSILLRPVNVLVSMLLGMAGGGLLGLFILGLLFRRTQLIDGNEVDLLSHIRTRKDHASVLATGFLLMSVYVGLNMIKLLPPLYTDQVPETYIELVNAAESGEEKAVDGEYRHNKFQEELDKFLEHQGDFYQK